MIPGEPNPPQAGIFCVVSRHGDESRTRELCAHSEQEARDLASLADAELHVAGSPMYEVTESFVVIAPQEEAETPQVRSTWIRLRRGELSEEFNARNN